MSQVLDEFRDAYSLSAPLQPVSNFSSSTDTLFLEDVSGRITVANISPATLVCGVILGIRGHVDDMGVFQAVDFVSALSCVPSSSVTTSITSSAPSILLVSGFEMGSATNILAQQLLADAVSGRNNIIPGASSIVGVIIAGNSMRSPHVELLKERHLTPQQQQQISAPSKHVRRISCVVIELSDGCFSWICCSVSFLAQLRCTSCQAN